MARGLGFVVLPSILTIACSQRESFQLSNSAAESVDIPQTEIKDQGRIGLCWSYATIAFVESLLIQKNIHLDFSEEALGFYRIAEFLFQTVKTLPSTESEFLSVVNNLRIDETGWVLYPPGAESRPENFGIHDGIHLILNYGLVPESVWSFKFSDKISKRHFFANIQSALFRFVNDVAAQKRTWSSVSFDELIDRVMVGDGRFPTKPPTEFEFNGRLVKPTNFVVGIQQQLSHLVSLVGGNNNFEPDFDKIVAATKNSLAAGVPVPIGFSMSIARIHKDTFSGEGLKLLNSSETYSGSTLPADNVISNFASDGGHMMLAVDFMNVGGKMGSISPDELAREVAKPASDLEFLKLRNSWGIGDRNTDWGFPVASSADGFYKVDKQYLIGAIRVAGVNSKYVPLAIVVDKKFVP